MILHLTFNEKVISRTITYFEQSLPGQNKFIVFPNKRNVQYVKSEESFVYYSAYGTKRFWDIVGDVKQYQHIVLHFLWPEMVDFVLKIPNSGSITWFVWGADLYKYLLEAKGYQLYAYPEDIRDKSTMVNKLKAPFLYLKKKYDLRRRVQAIKKIEYVGILQCDLFQLKKFFPEFSHLKQKRFFYYPIDDILGNLYFDGFLGCNIIVGNSASYTNNHRYVFEKLHNCDLGSRKVIVPLSYGFGKELVIKAGEIIKDHFYPILDFLPLDEYNYLLTSASTFIYGHFRQEAFGNILVAFYLGGVVFLDKRNPLFSECITSGYVLFSLDQLPSKINYRLSDLEKKTNQELVLKNYNRELLLSYIKESFGSNVDCQKP